MNKIIIIFSGSFPIGGAYTNRMLGFAKGFRKLGYVVKIYVVYPGDHLEKKINNKLKGSYNNIDYEYTVPTLIKPKNFIEKAIIAFIGTINLIKKLNSDKNEIYFIISGTSKVLHVLSVYLFTRIHNIKFIRELNEYPHKILYPNLKNKIHWFFIEKHIINLFDALILISSTLKFFYSKYYNKPIKIIPIIVEPERFKCKNNNSRSFYITFCGTLYGEKDGVDILIKSFKKVSEKFPQYRLLLIGDNSDKRKLVKLLNIIKELGLNDKIEFTGYVDREEIPCLLCQSDVLVLSRPNNIQARAGFPTKLGEYLATGKPVVVTKTSDIELYLKDGQNAYLVEPDSIELFSEKLLFVLSNYEDAKIVGKKGMVIANTIFNYKYQVVEIYNFIKAIQI
ncbi:glycosyltransferase [Calditrichota bacterium LG25]